MPVNLENIEAIDKSAAQYIMKHRDSDKIYSGHDESHLKSVAQLTELAGLAAGYCLRDIELSRIAGWFHDFERSMNETNAKSDETLSAQAAVEFTKEIHSNGLYYTTSDEREAIENAILKAGRPPECFTTKPDLKQWTLPERLLASLFVADKMEQNGVWVIARRSQFVAGARLRAEDADLPKYGLQPDRDENKAVLLEGALRIAFLNPEGIYPPIFKPLTSRMYNPQRDFLHGLLAAEGMSIDDYASLILDTRLLTNPNRPNYLEARKLKALDKINLIEKLCTAGGLSDEGIKKATGNLAESASEAVAYFSNRYKQPLDTLVQDWKPQNNAARSWQVDMLEYISGEWFNQMRSQLLVRKA